MIAIMFGLMVLGLIWLLVSREGRQSVTLGSIYQPLPAKPYEPQRSPVADMIALMGVYTKVIHLNPDSLTVRDTVFLKQIDHQLNSMLHEKDRL